jgi:hypothetical protein
LLKAKVMGATCEKHKREEEWSEILLPNGREKAEKSDWVRALGRWGGK